MKGKGEDEKKVLELMDKRRKGGKVGERKESGREEG